MLVVPGCPPRVRCMSSHMCRPCLRVISVVSSAPRVNFLFNRIAQLFLGPPRVCHVLAPHCCTTWLSCVPWSDGVTCQNLARWRWRDGKVWNDVEEGWCVNSWVWHVDLWRQHVLSWGGILHMRNAFALRPRSCRLSILDLQTIVIWGLRYLLLASTLRRSLELLDCKRLIVLPFVGFRSRLMLIASAYLWKKWNNLFKRHFFTSRMNSGLAAWIWGLLLNWSNFLRVNDIISCRHEDLRLWDFVIRSWCA